MAEKVIAVSKTTKKDLTKLYNLPSEKVKVVYNGFEKRKINRRKKTPDKIKRILEKDYILYVGTLQPRKNVKTLLEAFRLLLKRNKNYHLVIVGKKGWMYDEIFNQVDTLKLGKRVAFTGHLPDRQLALLYKGAEMFVLPSLYEGFGIPILEAMSQACPVISSFTSSLPEIGGEACLYFDPNSPHDLKSKILQLAENDALKKELVKKGKKRVKLFSWQKCAQETLEVLKSLKSR